MSFKCASVYILDVPYCIDSPYDYFIPFDLTKQITRGSFVTLPFGSNNRKRIGLVVKIAESNDEQAKLKPIISVCSTKISLDDEMLSLAYFIKEQTLCTISDAIHAMIPASALSKLVEYYKISTDKIPTESSKLSASQLFIYDFIRRRQYVSLDSIKVQFGVGCANDISVLCSKNYIIRELEVKSGMSHITENSYSLNIPSETAKKLCDGEKFNNIKLRTEIQREIIRALIENDVLDETGLLNITSAKKAQLNPLINNNLIKKTEKIIYRDMYANKTYDEKKELLLNDEQTKAHDILSDMYHANKPSAALLYGITGSGKTSVIMSIIDTVIKDGRGAIVLLPEIALTPQTLGIFCSRYGDSVAIIHSGLSQGERLDTHMRIKDGKAQVVIGTRSAVFAPLPKLGLIVIDEEQEHTYKSDMNPKYHARDIARFRCAKNNALMLLSSATPSLESYYKAVTGKYTLIKLKERYGNAKLPSVVIADMREETKKGNNTPLSEKLCREIIKTYKENQQSILFINRRGYNNYVSCKMCGYTVTCPRCSVAMTYHTHRGTYNEGELVCHWCGMKMALPPTCPSCGNKNLARVGFGTQRIEQELSMLVPQAKVLRMDTDTTGSKFSYDKLLGSFKAQEADILLGTQMVTKGHDFPLVTLVGVLLADMSLYLDDYRASERTFAMLTQVIGRAGRAENAGLAVIQTNNPDNEIIALACEQNYEAFYEREIRLRKLLAFPPYCDIALLTLTSTDENELQLAIKNLSDELKKHLSGEYSELPTITFGPFEAPVYKVDNKFRMRLVIKCKYTKRLREMFSIILKKFGEGGKRRPILSIDINPSNL